MDKQALHTEVAELLPWLVNGSLEGRERARVLQHLEHCAQCREARDRLQATQVVIQDDEAAAADYRPSFNKLMSRIDAAEANRVSTSGFERVAHRSMANERRWIPFAVAASVVAIAIFAGTLAIPVAESPAPAEFKTLTSTPAPVTGLTHHVEVTFEDPNNMADVRRTLIDTQSAIVAGPDANGTYLLEVKVPSNLTDTEYLLFVQDRAGVTHASYAAHPHAAE